MGEKSGELDGGCDRWWIGDWGLRDGRELGREQTRKGANQEGGNVERGNQAGGIEGEETREGGS